MARYNLSSPVVPSANKENEGSFSRLGAEVLAQLVMTTRLVVATRFLKARLLP